MNLPRPGMVNFAKRPQRYRKPCPTSGKVRWLTERDAERWAERAHERFDVYFHYDCQCWHVTTKGVR